MLPKAFKKLKIIKMWTTIEKGWLFCYCHVMWQVARATFPSPNNWRDKTTAITVRHRIKYSLCTKQKISFFLWFWYDCTWSSVSVSLKAVTSEEIKHKKVLVYWPCLPPQKSTSTSTFYLKLETSLLSKRGLSVNSFRPRSLSSGP
jgi:hypothetical protein